MNVISLQIDDSRRVLGREFAWPQTIPGNMSAEREKV
jgi:hypothetical protein